MKRLLTAITLSVALLAGVLQAGCTGTAKPVPETKTPQESQKPTQQPPGQKPGEQKPEIKPAAESPGQYFPLTLGSTWVYQGEGNEYASFKREVIFARDNRGQIMEDNGGTVMAVIYQVTEGAVTRTFSQPETYDRVNLLDRQPNETVSILKTPFKVGTKWKDSGGEREVVEVNATVSTPAGKFENCLKIKIPTKDSTVFEYFKAGVGMVKREFISGETRVTSSLEKYNIAKAEKPGSKT